ncbi:plastocyanin/azurin family copper-binding protein [Tunicatimonas pelagia]|uniref:plastocyanin/azurin family copper-binding protein n=1 Tax=Tunicatimonas pelagia TaxID=931531 RepID=UPI0026661BD4|nr:plastocyanin/azurin family copper-binding protein [Tunicatimonas pelagia]WKN43743.1 plastocyanin/azurin family copper-binding protein [Tunicatimonas pelagia]
MKNFILLLLIVIPSWLFAQAEDDYYRIETIPIPDSILLEVGGLAFTDDGKLGVSTRRGEVWLLDRPTSARPTFTRFAHGLHEPLGLAYRNGSFYTTQRAEVTKLTDNDSDGVADRYQSIYSWPLSGNYHEYSYGPLFLPNGDMLVTLNLAWIGYGESPVKWRGWLLKITEDGNMTPIATGLRSPAGFGFDINGEIFYGENQGDWIGSGRITHLEKGDFAGNPAGLNWSQEPNSPLRLKRSNIPDSVGLMHEFAKNISSMKPPTVWFPHTIMGISTSDIMTDTTQGGFGPFAGQMFVGDQGHSKVMRVFLEKINGEYQGACFPFREGFSSGILRMRWGPDDNMYVGMTSRGWASTGKEPYGLQRLVWTGKTPFEIKAIRAVANGFELEFTQPVDESVASQASIYPITNFIYSYHRSYGSPIINQQACQVHSAEVSADRTKVRLHMDGLREGYIHEIKVDGLKSASGQSLLHDVGYYTLNNFAEGTAVTAPIAQNKTSEMPPCEESEKRITEMPNDWEKPDVVINIGTEPGLKYDLSEFTVAEGDKVQIIFNNNDDMLHNLVVTEPNVANQVGEEAMTLGLAGTDRGYVPIMDEVLFHTCILQPETSESIYFVAPPAGEYEFVCTFPGHYKVMRGKMVVTSKETASR